MLPRLTADSGVWWLGSCPGGVWTGCDTSPTARAGWGWPWARTGTVTVTGLVVVLVVVATAGVGAGALAVGVVVVVGVAGEGEVVVTGAGVGPWCDTREACEPPRPPAARRGWDETRPATGAPWDWPVVARSAASAADMTDVPGTIGVPGACGVAAMRRVCCALALPSRV